MNHWDQIRNYLQKRISEESYDNWLRGTSFVELSGDTLFVAVPDRGTRAWLEREYSVMVKVAIEELGLPFGQVAYEPVPMRNVQEQSITTVENSDPDSGVTSLNPKFTFDSFVVGACNQFAHAAARPWPPTRRAATTRLFLYGGVGMGKTHLMHAIGRELMDKHASMRIIYTSSERFMNEMIACIRTDRMQHFHHRYREADVLLIDDIHVLGTRNEPRKSSSTPSMNCTTIRSRS
jgi:chromosomal replication initiator protein